MTRLEEYQECEKDGLTYSEAAKRLGVRVTSVRRFASANGIRFVENMVPSRLTREQLRDFVTLKEAGGYSEEQALAMVSRPKVKMRAAPKEGGK